MLRRHEYEIALENKLGTGDYHGGGIKVFRRDLTLWLLLNL